MVWVSFSFVRRAAMAAGAVALALLPACTEDGSGSGAVAVRLPPQLGQEA